MTKYSGFLLSVLFWMGLGATVAQAQVTTDSTLSTTVTSSDNLNFVIENGDRSGTNLFHSFDEFSVPTNGSAIFNNATDIQNIFSRVTGSTISNIDGLIQANGSANLFLLNPSGIRFGGNAQLNLGGDFFATTADRLLFDDGFEFSASDPQTPTLLTINTPIGVQFGDTATRIVNRSQAVDASSGDRVGLQVDAGQSISLVGGPILMENGHLTTSGGDIELGSVGPNSIVDINPNTQTLSYGEVESFRDISLTQEAYISANGEGGGRIQVQGRQIAVDQGATIRTETLGRQSGEDLIVRGSEKIELTANSSDSEERLVVVVRTMQGSTGNGGDLLIETPFLQVGDRAWLGAFTNGAGNGGAVTIRANRVEAISSATDDFSFVLIRAGVNADATGQGGSFELETQQAIFSDALVGSYTAGQGDAGDVLVEVESLELREGAQLQTLTFGDGNAGDMVVRASESVDLIGITSFLVFGEGPGASGLFVSAEPDSTGHGGSIVVETPRIRIVEGAKIAANALGSGHGGDIVIRTTDLEVSDPVIDFVGSVSGIVASTEASGTGNSGNIHIETERLQVFDGGQILSSAFGNGQAGNINILAEDIEVTGISDDGAFVSRIAAMSESDLDAGSVTITADQVNVLNRAELNVSNQGSGDAGNLQIITHHLFLDQEGHLTSEVSRGSQGNIDLVVDEILFMDQNSLISTNALDTSTGGNIAIASPLIVGLNNSDIVANAIQGDGGNIQINTQSLLGLQFRDRLTPDNDITASSQFGISGTVEINDFNTDPNSGLVELPSGLVDSSNQISQGCASNQGNTFIATGRGGIAAAPTELMDGDRPWFDTRDLSAFWDNKADSVVNNSAAPLITNEPLQEATGMAIAPDGTFQLIAAHSHSPMPTHPTCTSAPNIS